MRFVRGERKLDMIGAFCCYDLWDPAAHDKGRAYARKVAALLNSGVRLSAHYIGAQFSARTALGGAAILMLK